MRTTDGSGGLRTLCLVGLVSGVALVSGCSSGEDAASPVTWYRSADDTVAGTAPPPGSTLPPAEGSAADATLASVPGSPPGAPPPYTPPSTIPGASEPYPNLASVPATPTTRSSAERAALQSGLVADRVERRYSDETIALQGPSDGIAPPSAPPPPPDLSVSTSGEAVAAASAGAAAVSAATDVPPPPPMPTSTSSTTTSSVPGAPPPPSASIPPPPAPGTPPPPPVVPVAASTAVPPPVPSSGTESYLPPPPPPSVTALDDDAPVPYSPPGTEPGSLTGTPVEPATPESLAATPPTGNVTAGVESVFRAALQEQNAGVVTAPAAMVAPAPPTYTGGGVATPATGVRTIGRGPGDEQLVSYRPTGDSLVMLGGPSERIAAIQFADGSASLSGRDRQILREVAVLWQQRGGKVHVIGHASSNAGSLSQAQANQVNQRISERRAENVAGALARSGVPRSSIVVAAVGAGMPQYVEDRATGRAGNRRVDIVFVQ